MFIPQQTFYLLQVISPEEYENWVRKHTYAESALEDRDQLLLESANRIEKDFELLGEYIILIYNLIQERKNIIVFTYDTSKQF